MMALRCNTFRTRRASTAPSWVLGVAGITGQHWSGRGDRIDNIGIAIAPTDLPVRAHHLNDRHLLLTQMPGQVDPVGAGALDPAPANFTEAAHPGQQALIAQARSPGAAACAGTAPPVPWVV